MQSSKSPKVENEKIQKLKWSRMLLYATILSGVIVSIAAFIVGFVCGFHLF